MVVGLTAFRLFDTHTLLSRVHPIHTALVSSPSLTVLFFAFLHIYVSPKFLRDLDTHTPRRPARKSVSHLRDRGSAHTRFGVRPVTTPCLCVFPPTAVRAPVSTYFTKSQHELGMCYISVDIVCRRKDARTGSCVSSPRLQTLPPLRLVAKCAASLNRSRRQPPRSPVSGTYMAPHRASVKRRAAPTPRRARLARAVAHRGAR